MKEKEDIEFKKLISEKYDGYAPPPAEEMWDKIQVDIADLKVDKLNKRLGYYRWLTISLLLLLIGGGVLYQFKDENIAVQPDKKTPNSEEQLLTKYAKEENVETPQGNEKVKSNETTQTPNIEKVQIPQNIKTIESPQLEVEPDLERAENTPKKKNSVNGKNIDEVKEVTENLVEETTQKNAESNLELVAEKETLNTNDNNQTKSTGNEESPEVLLDNEELEEDNNQGELRLNEEENTINAVLDNEKDALESNIDDDEQEQLNNQKAVIDSFNNVIAALNEQIAVQDSISDVDTSEINIANNADSSAVPSDASEKALSRITVSALFMPTYSHRSLQDVAGNSTDLFNTHQGASFQYNAEIGVGYNVAKNLIVRLGFNYNKLKQEVELNDKRPKELPLLLDPDNSKITFYSSLGTVDITNTEFEFAGDDQDDVDLDDEDDFASLNFKEEQNFTFINIPVTLGYELGKKRFKLLLQGGLVTSITIGSSSEITLANIHSPEDVIKVEDYHQEKRVGLGSTISLGAKYNIAKRFSVLFLPTYNHFFTNLNSEGATVLKPYNYNISAGLQYRF